MAWLESALATGRRRLPAVPRRWQWFGCVALAVLCLLAAARLAALWLAEPRLPPVTFPQVVQRGADNGFSLYPDAATVAGDVLEEASFRGKLMGVIQQGERALASIELQGGDEKVFRVGDELATGVTLEAIEPLRVVVRERGMLRQLSLASLLDDRTPISVQPPAKTGSPARRQQLPLAVTPVLSDDGNSGLRIDQLSAELEAAAQVQRGDLVVAVDGVGITALMADRGAVAQLVQRDALTLTLVRNGRELSVDVDGELIRSMVNSK